SLPQTGHLGHGLSFVFLKGRPPLMANFFILISSYFKLISLVFVFHPSTLNFALPAFSKLACSVLCSSGSRVIKLSSQKTGKINSPVSSSNSFKLIRKAMELPLFFSVASILFPSVAPPYRGEISKSTLGREFSWRRSAYCLLGV